MLFYNSVFYTLIRLLILETDGQNFKWFDSERCYQLTDFVTEYVFFICFECFNSFFISFCKRVFKKIVLKEWKSTWLFYFCREWEGFVKKNWRIVALISYFWIFHFLQKWKSKKKKSRYFQKEALNSYYKFFNCFFQECYWIKKLSFLAGHGFLSWIL